MALTMKNLIKILFLCVLWFSCENPNEDIHGCLDSQACNYNPTANINNNSCIYDIDCQGECGGDAIQDNCGTCDNDSSNDCVLGCMDNTNCNYNSEATDNDSSQCLTVDCSNICGGYSLEDNCGTCDNNSLNDCVEDCTGEWGGFSIEDCSGVCNGNAEQDECGICNGPGLYQCWEGSAVCNSSDCPTFNSIDIYDIWKQNTNLEPDANGYYHFTYIPTGNYDSDYGTVKYFNEIPVTRTFWESPDSFWVYHQNQWIGTPIIDNSTYSGDDGYGQQLFYIYEPFVGDTLSIYGYICHENNFGDCSSNYLVKDSVFVIIE